MAPFRTRLGAARDHLMVSLPADQAVEHKCIRTFLAKAIHAGYQSRVLPFSLSKPEVLDYLPVTALVRTSKTWESLREELGPVAQEAKASRKSLSFKTWLTNTLGASFDDEHLRDGIDRVTETPAGFTEMIKTLSAHLASTCACVGRNN